MSEDDLCECDHVRFIHRPKCDGKYAGGKWVANSNRDCNCKEFKLIARYNIKQTICECCGQVTDENNDYIYVSDPNPNL